MSQRETCKSDNFAGCVVKRGTLSNLTHASGIGGIMREINQGWNKDWGRKGPIVAKRRCKGDDV